MALLEFIASLPPLSITAFPLFKQSPAASQVTFGLDSYIIPITPIGTLFCPICNPFGLVHILTTSPTGSGRFTTSKRPLAISSILLSSKDNLSSKASDMFLFFAFSISILFAFIMSSLASKSSFAISFKALSFSIVEAIHKS